MATRSKSGPKDSPEVTGIPQAGVVLGNSAFTKGVEDKIGLPKNLNGYSTAALITVMERCQEGSWQLTPDEYRILLTQIVAKGSDLAATELLRKADLAKTVREVLSDLLAQLSGNPAPPFLTEAEMPLRAGYLHGASRRTDPLGFEFAYKTIGAVLADKSSVPSGDRGTQGGEEDVTRVTEVINEILSMAKEFVNRSYDGPLKKVQALAWFVRNLSRLPDSADKLAHISLDRPQVWLFGSGQRDH